MALSQANQVMRLTTPLGEDALVAQSMDARESVSAPFHCSVVALSEQDAIAPEKIMGKPVTLALHGEGGQTRFFNGICVRFAIGHRIEHKYREYLIEFVPWLSMLKYSANCRIFQEKTVPEIIEALFVEKGFTDYQLKLQGNYSKRTYCVQYRETDFDFVNRLMEEEGIFYYFSHTDGGHELIICDYARAYDKVMIDRLDVAAGTHAEYSIRSWQRKYAFLTGKVAHTDYNFTTPATSLMADQQTILNTPTAKTFEVYDFPGEYEDKGLGGTYARNKMEAIEAGYTEVEASSDYVGLCAGFVFKVGENQNDLDANSSFVVKTVTHQASEGSYRSNGESFSYSNTFVCAPSDVPLRPLQRTPKPFIRGTQTAVVVGPSGEEIWTDEYGRVKVQFFWDREGKRNESSSCWIRVAQFWAGKKWGAQFIPRIGHEVLVSFLEGDPDRPLIIGSVYNADMMPTYEVPAKKTHSGIKSRSTKGGSTENFNEIRFEDEKGQELFYLHAEKDEQEVVENDQTVTIGHDQSISVGNDQSISVGNDQDISVGEDSTESIGRNLSQSVGNNTSLTTGANHTNSVGKNMSLSVGDNRDTSIGKNHSINVGENKSESIGKNSTLEIGKNLEVQVGDSHVEKVAKDYALSAKNITLSAMESISIKVGKAKITMKKNGDITISGGKINVKGSGKVTIKGSQIAEN